MAVSTSSDKGKEVMDSVFLLKQIMEIIAVK